MSMVALSDSRVIKASSGLTLSPGRTAISMISTVSKIADIREKDISQMSHGHTVTGLGFSGSIRYFSIASVTFAAGILPLSDNALSAATTT